MISIVIANYNGAHFLRDCLDSIKAQSYKDVEIILIDNGSRDNSVELLEKEYSNVRLIKNEENLGFVTANNQGFKESIGEYVLFLNNDIKAEPDAIEKLVERISGREELGAVFSKLRLMDEPDKLDAVGSFLTGYGFLYHQGFMEKDNGQYDNLREIFSPKGVCFLMPRKLLEEIGTFDEDFFAYFEESDLFWRLWLFGKKIEFVPQSVIYHKSGGTCTKLASPFIDYHAFKNRVCALIKNLGTLSLLKILPVHIFACLGVSLLYLCKLKLKNSAAILKAIGWNIKYLKATLRKRDFVQTEIRKISDKDLFKIAMRKVSLKDWWAFVKVYTQRW
ncbi:MAG: glycosyltransferase family 2 protein [Candidatus Omnitrophota bacterium]